MRGVISLHPTGDRLVVLVEMNADENAISDPIRERRAICQRDISIPQASISVAIPSESSKRSIRRATSRVRSFSSNPPHIAPESCPPWPGSRTTTANGPGAAEGCAALGSAADLALSVWRNWIQTKDAIISNKPERARIFRSGFTCDLRTMIFSHRLVADQGT